MSLKKIQHNVSFKSVLLILNVKVILPHKYLERSYSVLPVCAGPYAARISETEGKMNIPIEM